MADWAKQISVPMSISDGILDKTFRIYHADAAANPPFHPRIVVSGNYGDGSPFSFDRAMSELNLTDDQLAMISGAMTASVTGVMALEGFAQ